MTQPVTPDPSDLIVGTMRPPQWIGRVPPLVWLFAALAVLDVLVRLTFFGESGPLTVDSVRRIVVSLAEPAIMVAVPAAVVLGRHSAPSGRALFLGAVLLALAEGIYVGAQALDRVFVTDPSFGVDGSVEIVDRFAVVRVVAGILALAGAVFLAVGVRVSAVGLVARGPRRGAVALLAIAVVSGFVDLLILARYVSTSSPDLASLVSPLGLVGNAIGIVTGIAWGALAAASLIAWSVARGGGRALV